MNKNTITSIPELVERIEIDYENWHTEFKPWFRGEPHRVPTPLLPKLFRGNYNEQKLLQQFRARAPLKVDIPIPQRGHTDQWLFLAQHSGLPTRLLDWTEGLLIALYFAFNSDRSKGAVVWMLNPVELNRISSTDKSSQIEYSITWFTPESDPNVWIHRLLEPDFRARKRNKRNIDFKSRFFNKLSSSGNVGYNLFNINIRAAWENDPNLGSKLPVAIYPTYIHPRINDQLSRFTIWGKDKLSLEKLVDSNILRKYIIDDTKIEKMNSTLRMLGITKSSLFNDLDSLAYDIQNM